MKIKIPYYYNDFRCISSKCSDTCCAGWQIIIDDKTYSLYKNVSSEFGNRLNSSITNTEDNEHSFILEGDNCPFLNDNLLCDIYTNLGEDSLCYTCKTFPRIINEYASLREISLSMSCPEACRLLLLNNKFTTNTETTDEQVASYNSITPDLYIQLIKSQKIAFNIIQDSSMSLRDRIALLLSFSEDIQECIDTCELSKITSIRNKYSSEEYLHKKISSHIYKFNYSNIRKYFDTFNELEQINDVWPNIISDIKSNVLKDNHENYITNANKFNIYYKNREYEYENILSYFLFRYFLQALYDADILSKIKLAIFSYIIIYNLDIDTFLKNNNKLTLEDQIYIAHMYSKEIEHSDNNIEKLHDLFNNNKLFSSDNLLTSIT